jgi:hypothetical protein
MNFTVVFQENKQDFTANMNEAVIIEADYAINKKLAERLYDRELTDGELGNLENNVDKVINDFDDIKAAIISQGQDIPKGTPTAHYGAEINEVATTKYNKGVADGEKTEKERFWNEYQNGGKRLYYDEAFYGDGWTINNFEPIHNIVPVSAYGMFSYNRIVCDLESLLNELNIQLDFSKCKNMPSVFYTTDFLRVGKIDTASLNTSSWNMFARSDRLHTIKELVLYPDTEKYINFSNAFSGTTALVNIKITGTGRITQNINLGDCALLSEKSIINFMNYLSDETAGKTITFSRDAIINAFISLDSTSWKNLVNQKPNWLIALV